MSEYVSELERLLLEENDDIVAERTAAEEISVDDYVGDLLPATEEMRERCKALTRERTANRPRGSAQGTNEWLPCMNDRVPKCMPS
jgi:hypothetical protein